MISPSDLLSPTYLRVPDEARPTAMGLWLHTDVFGCRELVPQLIAADVYPGRDAVATIDEHLLLLDECGFLTMYPAEGRWWIALAQPLKADLRGATHSCPPPPSTSPRTSMAMGGAGERAGVSAGERARAQVQAEGERARERWVAQQESRTPPTMPRRPLILDLPPIGCSEHPDGSDDPCGPCGDARRRRDVHRERLIYESRLTTFYERTDEEPW